MTIPTAATLATPGHEADASIRGYNYQAYVAALEWCSLGEEEELHLEIAEDVAITGPSGARVIQVKDVARRLTLRSAHDFLDRVVKQIDGAGSGAQFQYLTTAAFGSDPGWHGVGAQSALEAWNRYGEAAETKDDLVGYLRSAARRASPLSDWLQSRTNEEVVDRLVPMVHWIANAPSLTAQEQKLAHQVASFCSSEFGLEQFKGRQLGRIVAGRIKELSAASDSSRRTLRRQDLRNLLLPHAKVSLEPREYADIAQAARLAKQVPVELLTQQLVSRLDDLKAGRFFSELDSDSDATALAADASEDGAYALAAPAVRSEVLAWCARLMVHRDLEAARALLNASLAVAPSSQQRLVTALIEAESDVSTALRTLLGLDTGEDQTARYLVLRRRGYDDAVAWLNEDALTPSDFDEDGRFMVLNDALNHFNWELAWDWLESLDRPAESNHPGLLWAAGIANYCLAQPVYLREWAFNLRPSVIDSDLSSASEAVAAKLRAIDLFDALEAHCRARGWTVRADLSLEHALWLKLHHPNTRFFAQQRAGELFEGSLLSKSSGEHSFRWLPLALAAQQEVDTHVLLNRIKSYVKRYGELNDDAAWALFALMQHLPPAIVLEDWRFFYNSLCDRINPVQLSAIKVQILARTGNHAAAAEVLAEGGLPTEVAEQLESFYLSKELSKDQIEAASPSARREIARRQKVAGDSPTAIAILEDVYRETQSLIDACNLASLHLNEGSLSRASDILQGLDATFDSEPRVALLKLRLALQLGNWQEALAYLDAAELDDSDRVHRHIEIAIQSLDWDRIPGLLQSALATPTDDPQGLLRVATVANAFGLTSIAQTAAERAAALADKDASILMAAYMLAVKGNWAEDLSADEWLLKAIAANDGKPQDERVLHRKSLQELIDMAPQWNDRVRSVNEMVKSAELFLAMAADASNESLTSIIFQAMRRNAAAPDSSARHVVPLFAGNDRATEIPEGTVAAVDCTSLIVLAYLDLLDSLPKIFKEIYIPHDFGLWLLKERDQSGYHQPSRVTQANDLIRWVVKRDIEVVPAKEQRGQLYKEVGRELADLIDACSIDGSAGTSFVVHPYPIYRVSSSMTRLADLPLEATTCLVSVRGLVGALDAMGMLSAEEMSRAQAFLGGNDDGWSNEPSIPSGAILYLDGLALSYLRSIGLIERCIAARFRLKIHDETSREAVALASYQDDSSRPRELLTRLQTFGLNGLRCGFIRSLPKSRLETDTKEDRSATRLLEQLFVDIPQNAMMVIDDRAGNRYRSMTDASGFDHPVASTLDVIDRLREAGTLSERETWAKRALLRNSGCAFVPVQPSEARHAAEDLSFVDGELREGYFARSLRESIQLLKMSRYVTLPLEQYWLTNTASTFRETITSLWDSDLRAGDDQRADWLFRLGRFSDFSASFLGDFDARRGLMQEALEVARYLVDPAQSRGQAYWSWVDESLCKPLKDDRPAAFNLLLEVLKAQLLRMKKEYGPEVVASLDENEGDARQDVAAIAAASLLSMPRTVKMPLLEDEAFCRDLGIAITRQTTAHTFSRPTFDTDKLYEAACVAWRRSASVAEAIDDKQRIWELFRRDESVVAMQRELSEQFEVAFAPLFSDQVEDRERHLLQLVSDVGGSGRLEHRWLGHLRDRTLKVSEIGTLRLELRTSPLVVRSSINNALRANPVLPRDLVPETESYFLTLAGLTPEHASLALAGEGLEAWGSSVALEDQLRLSLFRCIHSRFAPTALLAQVAIDELEHWIEAWTPTLDAWSIVGLIESLCHASRPVREITRVLRPLLLLSNKVLAPNSDRMVLSAALAAFVDQRVALSGLLGGVSPSVRRLASFSHAAMIEAEVLEAQIDIASFADWLEQFQTPFHAVSLADVHWEPRWSAVLLSPAQLGFELAARVTAAVRLRPEIAEVEELRGLLHDPDGVVSRHHVLYGGLPGPLEGANDLAQPLPGHFQDQLRESLDAPGANLSEGIRLVGHVGLLGRIDSDITRRVCDGLTTLIDSDATLLGAEDGGQAYVMLCHLAASMRDTEMARLLNRAVNDDVTLSTGLKIYLRFLCCAANADRTAWAKALDQLVLELGRDAGSPAAHHAYFILQSICLVRTDVVPLLQHRLATHAE
ncbi:TPA: tetratricopeptide repeat protein [Stenotrophomonas maltophilia]